MSADSYTRKLGPLVCSHSIHLVVVEDVSSVLTHIIVHSLSPLSSGDSPSVGLHSGVRRTMARAPPSESPTKPMQERGSARAQPSTRAAPATSKRMSSVQAHGSSSSDVHETKAARKTRQQSTDRPSTREGASHTLKGSERGNAVLQQPRHRRQQSGSAATSNKASSGGRVTHTIPPDSRSRSSHGRDDKQPHRLSMSSTRGTSSPVPNALRAKAMLKTISNLPNYELVESDARGESWPHIFRFVFCVVFFFFLCAFQQHLCNCDGDRHVFYMKFLL